MKTDWILPDWPAPPRIRAVSTTRNGGCSRGPYAGLNLGDHVGDAPSRVQHNRRFLAHTLGLSAAPLWLQQVHGCRVLESGEGGDTSRADAATTTVPGQVCAVMTADCLPLLLCNNSGRRVAAVHAGWRGLAAGVIEAALDRFDDPADEILAWLGPAIGPAAFEVGNEVRDRFLSVDPNSELAFAPGRNGRWLADIYQLARLRLTARGIRFVGGGDCCTVSEPERFFSYRRDGVTGRMATLIWIEGQSRVRGKATISN